ncbi:DUF222 domain-containing protein [Aeromicrobium sp. CF4.19]|uniref:HNH endonuclease signature motif containing protein n=1 Tax=Aeromicrobium sp. CF4.19 TaxID=3373082 RepID=UPI003EE5C102
MTAPSLEQHPVTAGDVAATLARVHALLDALPTQAYSGLAGREQREAAGSLARLKARVTAHELAAVAAVESSGTARREGASSTGSLLAGDFGRDRRGADAVVRQAKQIDQTPQTHEAMAEGRLSARQVRSIGRALDQLPTTVTPTQREACETQLVEDAPRMDLKLFERHADRVVGHFLTDSDDESDLDAAENDLVEQREKKAWAAAEFWMGPAVDGSVKGGFTIPEAQAAQLRVAVDALCAPQVEITGPSSLSRRSGEVLLDERPSYRTRQGWALTYLCELLPTEKLPETNNLGPIVTINLDHETLIERLKVATLSTGERISAGQARRMACEHRLLPAVFGGESLPLDLGRDKRLFSLAQRRGLEFRDQGCVFPGCDRPPGWCVAHHARRTWADGGGTDLTDGVLLCPHHHRILHDDGWDITFNERGHPALVPPATLDPHRRPRLHDRFRWHADGAPRPHA